MFQKADHLEPNQTGEIILSQVKLDILIEELYQTITFEAARKWNIKAKTEID